jgi:hypothetical protein
MKVRYLLIGVVVLFTAGMLPTQSYAKIDPDTCDGMWLFDEGKGNTVIDSTGKGNDGTLKNEPKWVEGKFGKAIAFDGTKQQSMSTIASTMMDPYPYTFMAWVKLDEYNPDGNTGAVVMGNYSGDSKSSIFYVSNSGMLSVRPHPGTDLKGTTKIPLGEWTHVAATLEGSTLKVYVNGEEDGSGNSAGYASGLSKPFVIGKASWYDGSFFTGVIDEAALFNIALTESEIRNIMNSGLEGKADVSLAGKLTTAWANIKLTKGLFT